MSPLSVEIPSTGHRRRYNIRLIVGVSLAVLLLGGIIAVVIHVTLSGESGAEGPFVLATQRGYPYTQTVRSMCLELAAVRSLASNKAVGEEEEGTGSNDNDNCASGPGYQAAKSYFTNPANKEKVRISSGDFKPIVQACDGNVDRALLCVANYIAYDGTKTEEGGRIPRFSPPPAAQHTVMSGYPVGACVLGGQTGTVYIGANFEFCSRLVETIHGEQCAVHNAAVHGEPSIAKLAVNAPPCGVCRQFLVEVGSPEALDVIFCDNSGKFTVSKLSSLLTSSFGPENLGPAFKDQTSLKHEDLYLVDIKDKDEGKQQALQMFKQAYAPYTKMPEGIVLKFKDGQTARGQTIENAAYNPSLTAFRGACSLAALKGYKTSDLTEIIYAHAQPSGMVGGNKCPVESVTASFRDILTMLSSSYTFSAKKPTITDIVVPLPKDTLAQDVPRTLLRLPL